MCIPLSAIRSQADYGVGDMTSVLTLLEWMKTSGLSVLQVLPINDLAPLDSSPYSPISAFALDPIYAALNNIPDLPTPPSPPAKFQKSARVRFADVRAFKATALRTAYRRFEKKELTKGTPRAKNFHAFCRAQAGWLTDYALFRILKERGLWKTWQHWPEEYRLRESAALTKLGATAQRTLRFYQYSQWILDTQWKDVRKKAKRLGILLYGDIPFGLNKQSSDVWSRQDIFDFTATMGAPPDQYSSTGQAWGLPSYRWSEMENAKHAWWRQRIKRAREHFDLFRLDHAVGFFRTWLIRRGAAPNGFDITSASEQQQRGTRFFKMCLEEGAPARPIAEDLGLIPPYVPPTLKSLKIPGYKIAPWEKKGEHFINPKNFPKISVATPGNHDMPTLASWWSEIDAKQRDNYWEMISGGDSLAPRFSPSVRDSILENIYNAASCLALIPFQDFFGARERINTPGTVRNRNWTYRMPFTVEELLGDSKHNERSKVLYGLARKSQRI
jgi:4-alpha-glucanotransferase